MAKFGQVYPGFARMGLESCTANMTRAEYTARSNCTQIFSCVMDSVSNYDQAVLGSGAAVLGFVSERRYSFVDFETCEFSLQDVPMATRWPGT